MQEGTEISSGHPAVTAGVEWRGDVYAANCPTRLLLDRIADKWTVLLLTTLAEEPMRFNALKRRIEGVSQKMLSQT
jgi:DNA-binding HxlR family transcriptional regulator